MTIEEAQIVIHRAIKITGINQAGMTDRDLANIATRNARGTDVEADVAAAISTLERAGLLTGPAYLTSPPPNEILLTMWSADTPPPV